MLVVEVEVVLDVVETVAKHAGCLSTSSHSSGQTFPSPSGPSLHSSLHSSQPIFGPVDVVVVVAFGRVVDVVVVVVAMHFGVFSNSSHSSGHTLPSPSGPLHISSQSPQSIFFVDVVVVVVAFGVVVVEVVDDVVVFVV